jgi:nucleoside-diphosphate-sugar epimerase
MVVAPALPRVAEPSGFEEPGVVVERAGSDGGVRITAREIDGVTVVSTRRASWATAGAPMALSRRRHDAVPAFMSQALRNEDVTVFGDGTQTRSFCYVSDLVDGILRLMMSDTNDPVNIGNPHEITIEEIARTIIRLIGSSSRIVYEPLPVDDPKQRRPDITRARTLLGWEPKVGLEEGLLKTVEFFRTRLAARA